MNEKSRQGGAKQFVLLVLLLTGNHGLNWMAVGDMSSTQKPIDVSIINNYLTTNLKYFATGSARVAFCKTLSDQLNGLYDPAWNVVVTTSQASADSVLYGYAFRGHWYWANGVNGQTAAVLVWKDYNCNPSDWTDLVDTNGPTMASNLVSQLNSWSNSFSSGPAAYVTSSDLWMTTQNYIEMMPSTYPDIYAIGRGLTLVGSEVKSFYYGRVCVKGFYKLPKMAYDKGVEWGSMLILQMRDAL